MCNHAQLLTCQSFSVLPPIPNNLIPRLQAIHFQAMCVEVKVANNRRLHTVCNQAIHFLLVISTLHDQHHRHDNQLSAHFIINTIDMTINHLIHFTLTFGTKTFMYRQSSLMLTF